MSCGCHTGRDQSTLERLQGYQRGDYGYGRGYAAANLSAWNTNHVLPYEAHPEPGNMGYRYAGAIAGPVPLEYMKGYGGNLPLSQQPRIDIPQPYTYRYAG